MNRTSLRALFAAGALVTVGVSQASAQYTVYTDLASWTVAVGGGTVITQNFNGPNTANTNFINFGQGLTVSSGSGEMRISSNQLRDRTSNTLFTTFNFAPPISAVSGFFSPLVGGAGPELRFRLNTDQGQITVTETIAGNANNNTFFGIVSNYAIASFEVRGAPGQNGNYGVDNLRYVSAVPEPGEYAVMGMIGLTLAGLMVRARKRQSA
ncbi:MAG: hypothetical protein OHK0029_00610 [Armatimonadaceae bacterium]